MVVIFLSAAEKLAIFRNFQKFKDKEEWSRVFFNEDVTEMQANEQRDLWALFKSKEYNACKCEGRCAVARRQVYRYDDIHRLPG